MTDNKKLLVFVGPSGVGKSFVMEKLLDAHPSQFKIPKLLTTRQPRPGESAYDRQFIELMAFEQLSDSGQLAIAEEFNGNWYGCKAEQLQPTDTHLLLNIWPALIPRLSERPDVVFIGMHVPAASFHILERRIRTRGDSPEVFKQRMERVNVDLQDLAIHRRLVEERGHWFDIHDDSSAVEVIAWVENAADYS